MTVLDREDIKELTMPRRIELMETLFELLSGILNDVHKTDYSIRFWKILLEGHVKAVISRRAILSSREIKRRPDLFAFNSSRIPTRNMIFKKRLIDLAKHLKSWRNLKKVNDLLSKNDKLRIGFFEYPGLDEEDIGIELPTYHPFIFGRGEIKKRKVVNRIAGSKEELFFANVIRELPMVLVEHFGKLYDSVKLVSPTEKELHVHTTQSFFNQVLIAKYTEQGARLVWYQHGSFYGEFAGDSEHHYEHDLSNEYRTWGWEIKEKDKPWKAYRLEKFKRDYEKHSNTKECDLLISFSRISDGNRDANKKIIDYLLNNLDPVAYKKVLARPHPANKVFNQKGQLDFISSSRVTKSTGHTHMAEDMSRCRVVLQMRVPSTNFLECIYTKHPTVGLLKNDEYTDIIEPYHNFFLEHGVLHYNLESLVRHLNSISIEDWWSELSNKKQFLEFRKTFARTVE
jgi:hypothetical protein